MKQANLELDIEKLILPDLPLGQRLRVAAIIEQELTRLWMEQGMPAGVVGDSLALTETTVQVAAGMAPDAMGVQVAQSIYQNMAGSGQLAHGSGKSTA